MEKTRIRLRVNGEEREALAPVHHTLLEVLREELALTGTKHGCELGECGTCTVLVDGRPVLSCLTLPIECEGRDVTTVEGLARNGVLHPLQQAFAELGAAQCGYCTPGFLLVAEELLRENPRPTRAQIAEALAVSQAEHALAVDKVRFVGDPVAAVAALDEDTAEEALKLVDVDYEVLPSAMSIDEALARPEARIHDYGPRGNVHKEVSFDFGDVEAGFAEADHVREDTFFFEGNTHLPMEQHAAVGSWGPDGKLTLWSATQTPHYVHRALAKVLELPPARVRVIATTNGGAFGGKSDPFSHEIVVAKLAMLTGRPVKITLTREEVFYCHRGRH